MRIASNRSALANAMPAPGYRNWTLAILLQLKLLGRAIGRSAPSSSDDQNSTGPPSSFPARRVVSAIIMLHLAFLGPLQTAQSLANRDESGQHIQSLFPPLRPIAANLEAATLGAPRLPLTYGPAPAPHHPPQRARQRRTSPAGNQQPARGAQSRD